LRNTGRLIIMTAPSGTGKSTLVHMLLDRIPNLHFSVSHTTRPPRPHEVSGRDYYFVDAKAFAKMLDERRFLEWAPVHGHHYGTSEELVDRQLQAGHDVLLDIDVQGATQVMRKRIDVVSIFVLPPSFEELKRRLEGRGTEGAESIGRRLERARREVLHAEEFHYVVVNAETEATFEEIRTIIAAEKCRPACRKDTMTRILATFAEPKGET